ncbi:MAG TPA: DeoR/GlpR transcriptional regulator [Firmicutes bacterium]|jgi:DeoR family fructose operon transcriptional repressor|nr:MAG: hypothetical protein AA931_10200 [Peptococcaceae bacterium 1109]HHT73402.1 DeoR/GlpR transcriptional regulator [Bacillota bacterium]
MLPRERQFRILELVNQRLSCSVNELSEELSVSVDTIRRDLKQLESKQMIQRTHGGAMRRPGVLLDPTVDQRTNIMLDEKRAIGAKAASLVADNEAIFIDAGTTTWQMAKQLTANDVIVITNAVNILQTVIANPRIDTIIVTGGQFRQGIYSLVGPETEEQLQRYRVDKLFLGVSGVSLDFGLTCPNRIEAQVKMKMIEAARQVILLVDHSKFDKVSLVSIAPVSRVDLIITDWNIRPELQRSLESAGVRVLVADPLK